MSPLRTPKFSKGSESTETDRACAECPCPIDDAERHVEEHRFIRGLMRISDKIDTIKWGFIGKMVNGIMWFLFVAMIIGVLFIASKHMNIGGGPKLP